MTVIESSQSHLSTLALSRTLCWKNAFESHFGVSLADGVYLRLQAGHRQRGDAGRYQWGNAGHLEWDDAGHRQVCIDLLSVYRATQFDGLSEGDTIRLWRTFMTYYYFQF
jgi:hypothetical protein